MIESRQVVSERAVLRVGGMAERRIGVRAQANNASKMAGGGGGGWGGFAAADTVEVVEVVEVVEWSSLPYAP